MNEDRPPLRLRVRSWVRDGIPLAAFSILRQAARLPTRAPALALANAIGWLFYISPVGRARLRTIRQVFPDGPAPATAIARRSLTLPYRDFVVLRRLVLGKADTRLTEAEFRSEMPESTRALFAGDQSVIIAIGHFAREATRSVYAPGVVNRRLLGTVAETPETPTNIAEARLAMHFGQMLDAIATMRNDTKLVTIGNVGGVRELVRHLSEPGWALIQSVDAPRADWMPVGLTRPFAGHAERAFADGAAQLARMAQVPIVAAITYVDRDGAMVIAWSEPFAPPARKDREADAALTSEVLDLIEVAIGRRPDQYVVDIGGTRSWDPVQERWHQPAR